MLLGALGACTGINAVLLLKKFKQAYRSLAVECEGEQEPDWPHAFTGIEIRFVIGWEEGFTPDDELVKKALDLACNQYCPVDATRSKLIPYESGIVPTSPARQRLSVRFYLTAMLFIVFDVEAIFFYPWAVVLHQLRWYGVIEMFVFILVLAVVLAHIWRKGGFEWE